MDHRGCQRQTAGVICDVLGRRIRGWTMDFVEEGGMTTALAETNPQFLCVSLAESVEKLIRPLLRDRAFELDGEDARRYLVFDNVAFDRQTGACGDIACHTQQPHNRMGVQRIWVEWWGRRATTQRNQINCCG